jgi:hypothetical protein
MPERKCRQWRSKEHVRQKENNSRQQAMQVSTRTYKREPKSKTKRLATAQLCRALASGFCGKEHGIMPLHLDDDNNSSSQETADKHHGKQTSYWCKRFNYESGGFEALGGAP